MLGKITVVAFVLQTCCGFLTDFIAQTQKDLISFNYCCLFAFHFLLPGSFFYHQSSVNYLSTYFINFLFLLLLLLEPTKNQSSQVINQHHHAFMPLSTNMFAGKNHPLCVAHQVLELFCAFYTIYTLSSDP